MNAGTNKTRTKFIFLSGLLLFLLALAGFAFIAHEIVQENEDMFDTRVFNMLAPYSQGFDLRLMHFFTFFGSHLFLLPAHLLIAVALIIYHRWTDFFITGFMAISSYVLTLGLKHYFHRSRPLPRLTEIVNNFSFPSGHTFSSFVFAVVLIYLLWQSRWKTGWKVLWSCLLLALVVMVGLSRIILRAHYPSDVLASFCIGTAWMIFTAWVVAGLRRLDGGYEAR